jgi:hypothetical protein
MVALRLSVPIGCENEIDRQHFLVHISSIDEWHMSLYARSQKKLPYYEQKPAVLTGDKSHRVRRLALVDNYSHGNEKRDALTAAHKSASDREMSPLSSPKNMIPRRTSSRRGSADSEEEKIRKNREEALLILEGTQEHVPNRNYTGPYANTFRIMARREMESEHILNRVRHMSKGALHGSTPPLRGWKFLRTLILSELDEKTAQNFPPYSETQRVFMLTTEQVRGRERVRSARNLDACTISELLKLIARLEERNWRDVLWVSIAGDDLPSTVDMKDDNTQDLRWGNANII